MVFHSGNGNLYLPLVFHSVETLYNLQKRSILLPVFGATEGELLADEQAKSRTGANLEGIGPSLRTHNVVG